MESIKNILLRFFTFYSFILGGAVIFFNGCAGTPTHPLFQPSGAQIVVQPDSFAEYVHHTELVLRQNRYFLTANRESEIEANRPFEIKPQRQLSPSRGVLLVHGLGDSPYSFVDIAPRLAAQGFLVRTILLPGCGTRPADLLKVDAHDWEKAVARHVALLKAEVDQVYLGGFSTGANLVFAHAAADPDIAGLMLFSPAFQSNESLDFLSPLLAHFQDWLTVPEESKTETDYARYAFVPVNAFAQYYQTSAAALANLKTIFDRPVFMVLTEHDSILRAANIKKMFDQRFINPQNRLIWFGSERSQIKGRTRYINSYVPSLRIRNMSHMGVLFSPANPHYGKKASERICHNAPALTTLAGKAGLKACLAGEPVWFSAFNELPQGGKFYARLTFNPAFDLMMTDLAAVFKGR